MSSIDQYRATEQEKERTADLLRILPRGRHSVLDIGAGDGHFSRLLTEYFSEVTALDLHKPAFEFPGVVCPLVSLRMCLDAYLQSSPSQTVGGASFGTIGIV